jgi:hypothetical protein
LVQVGLGFLSDVENMGMYDGEMQDGQPHGNGTIGKENMFMITKNFLYKINIIKTMLLFFIAIFLFFTCSLLHN